MTRPAQPASATPRSDDRRASEHDDVDEQFRSLLEGLRTSLPGVQVLFGFLLIAPFQADFADYDTKRTAAFTVAFFTAGLASILLIASSVHQRVRAPLTGLRRHSKQHLIITTWLTIVGTAVMGVAIVSTIFLVTTFVLDDLWTMLATTGVAATLLVTWFYVPLVTFRR